MSELEWLACTNLRPMLKCLWAKASDRKSWLLVVACRRLVWHLLPDLCHRVVRLCSQSP
jgi:hypothetical protein